MGNIKIYRKGYFFTGMSILALMILFYFIKLPSDSGDNYIIYDSLLGKLIFHNPFILGLYILIAIVLTFNGLKKGN